MNKAPNVREHCLLKGILELVYNFRQRENLSLIFITYVYPTVYKNFTLMR
jgi:hypothetical protein